MTGKVLVTGATRGIGKAICNKFLSNDFEVIGIARKKEDTPWTIKECDLSDTNNVKSVFEELSNDYGIFNVLVNNAGIYHGASCTEETLEQYENTMNVNARATFQLCQLFGEKLISNKSKGSIINVSSVSGRIGSIDPAYAASKAAVDALTKSFARGYASAGIRVNSVSPGPINTEMAANIPEERKKQYTNSILQGRFGEPEEIANLVYFLSSEEASLLTGEIYFATGGIL